MDGGGLHIKNGNGDDLTIAGVFEDARDASILPTLDANSSITISTGGILRISVKKNNKDGYASNQNNNLTSNITWQHGSIFDWAVNEKFFDGNVVYFPNNQEGIIPVFRITGQTGTFPEIGTSGLFNINGLLEVNKDITFSGSGLKTLRNGIIGSSSLTMKLDADVNKNCGKILINGATSIIGGGGSLVLNANGLDVSSAMCTLISNKTINQNIDSGTLRLMSNATLIAQTFEMSGSAIFHQQDSAHLKTAHVNGVSGSIQTTTYSHGNYCHFTFNGSVDQITGVRMPKTLGDLYIENNVLSSKNVSVSNTGLLTIQGNLTILYGQFNLNPAAGSDMDLHGHFTRYTTGFYNDNNHITSFTGSKNSEINRPLPPPATEEFPTFQDYGVAIVNKANGFKVILNTPTGIRKKLTLINGIIDAEKNPLYIKHPVPDGADDGVTGGNNNSYVSGALYRYMSPSTNGNYLFPVGRASAGKFRPVRFTTTTKSAFLSPGAVYKAEFFSDNNVTPSSISKEYFLNTLQGILKDEYWQFDKAKGHDSAKGKLAIAYTFPGAGNHWRDAGNGSTSVPLLDATQCSTCAVAVVKRNADFGDGKWDFTKELNNFDTTEAKPINQSGYIVSGELSSFSPFTIGFSYNNILATKSIPVRLLQFSGQLQLQQAQFSWQVNELKGIKRFFIEASNNSAQSFAILTTVQPNGLNYQLNNVALPDGKTYFRLRIELQDGTSMFSKVIELQAANTMAQAMRLLTQPGSSQAVLQTGTTVKGPLQLQLVDMTGRQLYSIKAATGSSNINIPMGQLIPGQYILRVLDAAQQQYTFRLQR